jgi:hypothetical protein
MQVSNHTTDARPSAPRPVDRVKAPTPMSDIEAAADFERWLDQAQAAASVELPPTDESSSGNSGADEAPAPNDSRADGEAGEDGSFDDNDSERDLDPRFSQPAWAAQSFGAGTPALDAAALQQAQHAPAPQAWAEIAAQIERLLITDPAGRPDGAAALFRLAPELLRDTTVALSRTPQGWLLRIDSQDARLRIDSNRHEDALRERFARGGLGELTIEQGDLPDLVHAVGA